jgi:hypothetical protein
MNQIEKLQNFIKAKQEKKAKQLVGVALPMKMYNDIKTDAIKEETTIQNQIRNRLALAKLNKNLKDKSKARNEILLRKIEALLIPKTNENGK